MDYDSCVVRSLFDPCCYTETYIDGCGGPYFTWSDWFGTTIECDLLYFNKKGDVWGEPIANDCEDLLSDVTENPRLNNSILVYPNPFSAKINIESEDNRFRIKEIKLLDIHANLIIKIELLESNYTISPKVLSNGVYILEIQMENGNVIRKKVIKN